MNAYYLSSSSSSSSQSTIVKKIISSLRGRYHTCNNSRSSTRSGRWYTMRRMIYSSSQSSMPVVTSCQTQQCSMMPMSSLSSSSSMSSSSLVVSSSFSTITRGQDLLAESLAHGSRRKIILDSYYPGTGVDVIGMIDYTNQPEANDDKDTIGINNNTNHNINSNNAEIPIQAMMKQNKQDQNDDYQPQNLLMNSSIIAFPHSCFLWNHISQAKDVTAKSLSLVQFIKPSIECLFIGCDEPLPPRALNELKREMKKSDIVVEQMDVMNAMGTFNILNGEDRRVAVALVVDVENKEEEEEKES